MKLIEEEKFKWNIIEENGITPTTIIKDIRDVIEAIKWQRKRVIYGNTRSYYESKL